MSKTTKKLDTIEPVVTGLLMKDNKLCDNDRKLVIEYWKQELEKKYRIPINTVSLQQFFDLYEDKNNLGNSESITRSKRDILKKNPELRGKIYELRQEEAEQTRKDIKNR